MPAIFGMQVFRQPPSDLVQHQADQRLGAADVGRRYDEIECRGACVRDQVGDAPVATARDLRHDGIAIEAEERHGGRQHAGPFIVGFVEQLPRRGCHHRMRSRVAQVGRGHHRLQRRFDRALRIGQEGRDAGQGLIRLGVEDMQDGADQQRVAGLLPVVAALQRAFRIDQHVGDVLDIANFPLAAANLEQRVVGGGRRVGGVEQQHTAMQDAETGGERPVLALDVMDDGGARPGQQRGDDEAHALAGPSGGEAEHMLRTIMAEILAIQFSEHDAIRPQQPRALDFDLALPSGPNHRSRCSSPRGHARRTCRWRQRSR